MKQTLIQTSHKKIIPLSLGMIAMAAGMGVQAKTINADVGPVFNQFFANIQCERAASKLNGKWNGKYWKQPGTVNGVCQIVVPDPVIAKPIKRAPIKSTVNLISVNAGRLWNQAHADTRCPQLAKENNGRWNGKWSEKENGKPSYCQVEVTIRPAIPKPTYKIINAKAGRIWSDEHAKQHCPAIAKKSEGSWTGKWSDQGNHSTCQVKVSIRPEPSVQPHPQIKPEIKPPRKPKNIREVSAGNIRNQSQANRRCARTAKQISAEWTGNWRKTGKNNEAVCEMRFQSSKKPGHRNNHTSGNDSRDVDAGPIWDQAQASKKCPLIAAQSNSSWTGEWRKLNNTTHRSVCTVTSGNVAVPPNDTVITASTTYVDLTPDPDAQNIREVFAGPIWDGNQAKTKCPIIAANNNGTWTGQWRKTGPEHSSVCEVSF